MTNSRQIEENKCILIGHQLPLNMIFVRQIHVSNPSDCQFKEQLSGRNDDPASASRAGVSGRQAAGVPAEAEVVLAGVHHNGLACKTRIRKRNIPTIREKLSNSASK